MDVVIAYSGTEGLEAAQQPGVALIILDVALPDMSGLDVCQRIRCFSEVPILMVAACAQKVEDMVRGLMFGADDYLLKPLDLDLIEAKAWALWRRCGKAGECNHS